MTENNRCGRKAVASTDFPEEDFWTTSESAIKCRIRLRRDSGRSSNRNRHLSPSVNTSRLLITNLVMARPDYSGLPTIQELTDFGPPCGVLGW